MKFIAIFNGVVALAKALPIVNGWIKKFVKAWNDKDVAESDSLRGTLKAEQQALYRAIQKADTDEDIKALSITLHRLNSGKLSND